jgi:hypothetical protein
MTYYCRQWLWQMTDPSSRQRGRPTKTRPQLSNSNKLLVMSPRWGSTPRLTDWLTDWPSVAMWLWLEESKLAQHAYEEGQKYVGMKRRSCRLNQTLHTGSTRNQPTCLCWTIRSVNPVWTSLPTGLPPSQQKPENYNSVQCRLGAKISCVGTIMVSILIVLWRKTSYVWRF